MTALRTLLTLTWLALLALPLSAHALVTVDFEDVGALLPIAGNDYYDGADGAGGFTSTGVHTSS